MSFSKALLTPTLPGSSPPWPASITMDIPLDRFLEVVSEDGFSIIK